MSAFIYLNSEDSKTIFPENNSFDFTVDLSKILTGRFLIALADFNCENFTEPLFVFCDIVNTSFMFDQYLPVLRRVYKNGEVQNLQYHRASRNSIQRVRVYIRDQQLNTPTTSIGRVTCLLKLISF